MEWLPLFILYVKIGECKIYNMDGVGQAFKFHTKEEDYQEKGLIKNTTI